MPRNVEIKARVARPEALLQRARALTGADPVRIVQKDTFFAVPQGRLKLRTFADGSGELIAYERADETGPKTSRYAIARCEDATALGELLAGMMGVVGIVEKTRLLLMAGRTRIHLDEVRSLGSFMELEVVLAPGETREAGRREAERLMTALGVDADDLVRGAYVDLLEKCHPPD